MGKSSLINAIFGEKLQAVNTIQSTTREFSTHEYKIDGAKILITDSPGYGEVRYDEQYSKEKFAWVKDQFKAVIGKRETIIVPTMADEEDGPIFGIDKFKIKLLQILPETARYRFARSTKLAEEASKEVLEQLDKEADRIITTAATSAGTAVFTNPVPVSDFLILVPIQIGMIIKLGAIYGETIDKKSAVEIVTTLGAGVATRVIFQTVVSWVPGIKNALGPPVASAATYGIGRAAKRYFKGQGVPTEEELKAEVEGEFKRRGDKGGA